MSRDGLDSKRAIRSDRKFASDLNRKDYKRMSNAIRMRAWRKANPEYARAQSRAAGAKLKIKTMNAYGGCWCALCGESDILTLSLDHVNNDGSVHRRAGCGLGKAFYQYLQARGWPQEPKLQVLCMNCNRAKATNRGVLPEHRRNFSAGARVYSLAEMASHS